MVIETILYIFIGLGIIFSLPSTMYFFMFLGVFYRQKTVMLERDDLTNSQYQPFAQILKKDILYARSLACEKVELKAKDGIKLFARYYDSGANKTIICVHGYQSNAFNNFSTALIDFLNRGYNVLLVDQRNYGDSGGKFTTFGHKEKDDLALWVDYVDQKKGVEHIIIYGISMGATTVGFSVETIKSNKVKGLILEAGVTCFYDELPSSLGVVFMKKQTLNCMYLMAKKLLKTDIKQSVESSLKNNVYPTLFLHGDVDTAVPIEFTDRNFNACSSKKQRITIEGAGHTLCFLAGGKPLHDKINEFIQECIS